MPQSAGVGASMGLFSRNTFCRVAQAQIWCGRRLEPSDSQPVKQGAEGKRNKKEG
jgi:hypothetical protein